MKIREKLRSLVKTNKTKKSLKPCDFNDFHYIPQFSNEPIIYEKIGFGDRCSTN